MLEITRRDLRKTTVLGGASAARAQPADPLAATRAQMAATPIETIRLMNIMTMLAGPGGNVIVQHGLDGKLIVDTFVRGAFAGLKQRVDALGTPPILFAIDTHWHFDHTDNNEDVRKAGATLIAHESTRKRLTEQQDLLGMHFKPAPPVALPAEPLTLHPRLAVNNES